MIPPKNNVPFVLQSLFCIAVVIACGGYVDAEGISEKAAKAEGRYFGQDNRQTATRVDWYKEPPDNIYGKEPSDGIYLAKQVVDVPYHLIAAVPKNLHKEAIPLLANHDATELTREQASHFGFRADPESALRSAIQEKKKELDEYRKQIAETQSKTRMPLYSVEQDIRNIRGIMRHTNSRIEEYRSWLRLKPYLVRAVSFFDDETSFSAELTPKALIITFGASGGRLAHWTMKKTPTVVYLPRQPQRVYTEMSNLD
jgi:hypothetical protein